MKLKRYNANISVHRDDRTIDKYALLLDLAHKMQHQCETVSEAAPLLCVHCPGTYEFTDGLIQRDLVLTGCLNPLLQYLPVKALFSGVTKRH